MSSSIKNVGKVDRVIRIIIGVFVLLAGLYFKSWWGYLGLIPLLTGLIGFCPLYSIIKVNTLTKK